MPGNIGQDVTPHLFKVEIMGSKPIRVPKFRHQKRPLVDSKGFFTLRPDVYRVTASSDQVLQAPALETVILKSSRKLGFISYDNGNLHSKRIYQRNV